MVAIETFLGSPTFSKLDYFLSRLIVKLLVIDFFDQQNKIDFILLTTFWDLGR